MLYIRDAYMTTPGIKSPSAKNNKFNKITESEINNITQNFQGKKNSYLLLNSISSYQIKGHPFSAINRINNFFFKI